MMLHNFVNPLEQTIGACKKDQSVRHSGEERTQNDNCVKNSLTTGDQFFTCPKIDRGPNDDNEVVIGGKNKYPKLYDYPSND